MVIFLPAGFSPALLFNGRLRRTYQCMSLAFMCFLSFFVYVLSSSGVYIAITTQWGGLWVVGGHQGGGWSSHLAPYDHWVGFVCMGAPPPYGAKRAGFLASDDTRTLSTICTRKKPERRVLPAERKIVHVVNRPDREGHV